MIGYMSLEEQIDADFASARRKALLGRLLIRLHNGRGSGRLSCFDEVTKLPGAVGGIRRGRRTVPLGQVAGSVGRCSDFDRAFLPAKASVGERWKRIDRAFRRGEELPPVSLYEMGGVYFVLDGNHRVSVYRYHGVEWVDAEVTEFFDTRSDAPSPPNTACPRTDEATKEHTTRDEAPRKRDHKMHKSAASTQNIEVRWGLREDEARIAELMDLNGIRRVLAFEERFIVAEKNGEVLAALRYRTESKRLLLGLLVSDPWTEERPLAVALYAGAGDLAQEIGVGEVRARSVLHIDDYPYEAGYRWRLQGDWYLDATRSLQHRKELPTGGWRRMVALQSMPAIPFFRALRGATRWVDERGASGPRWRDPTRGCHEIAGTQTTNELSDDQGGKK